MYDYLVIGGGIVGLSTALSIRQRYPNATLAIVEKEKEWASHQTGRNSGVIHSGIYYKPGSLKATLAKRGSESIVRFCQENNIAHDVCGKVIVAVDETEKGNLNHLYERGLENGLDVQKLTKEELKEVEPHVNGVGGIRVPSTGIVNYKKVTEKLAEILSNQEVDLFHGTRVTNIEESLDEAVVDTSKGTFKAKYIINCAGLQSDRIARLADIYTDLKIVPFRGEYFELKKEKSHLVKNLIYPVPNPDFPFLGVHLTRMMDGSIHAGPNAVLSLKREGYHKLSFNPKDALDVLAFEGFWKMAGSNMKEGLKEMGRSFHRKSFVKSLQRLVPEIQEEDVVPTHSGVRAQALLKNGQLVDDFFIIPGKRSIHVCNAPSPAATASLEIGKIIAGKVPSPTRKMIRLS
ncbi:L-2-hydroxyglutarate oxidase [Pseudalkalibacillus hwajinpoensis]|uniref:L-2-hydroxyglutarate oxidase n=1 Tax=Guptibacillus hwajinpoensis TaxID=208199 RepID=UPI001CD2B9E7|nr:L-2-hydroxyglutarate oxidase [Pseudalkalibacillus hwajinpoensis]MCA0992250.1 L-2-hydroxyglutarate oxidase [Pseudalkalibacillus hwajinpoensis]